MLVGGLEVDLAADVGHADRVAVVADPAHRAVEQVARADRVELAEAQRVEDRDRPRADREDVAEDAADPGRRPLEGFDRARVVVGLDLEGDRVAVADVDGAGVLARPHHHPLALGRQPPQQLARVLVGAVLGPEQAEHRQLDVVRLAPELLDDQLELGVGKPQLAVLGDLDRHAGAPRPRRRPRRPAARRSIRSAGRPRARDAASGRPRCRPRCARRRCPAPTRSGSAPARSDRRPARSPPAHRAPHPARSTDLPRASPGSTSWAEWIDCAPSGVVNRHRHLDQVELAADEAQCSR